GREELEGGSVASRLAQTLAHRGGWGDAWLALPEGRWCETLTGRELEGGLVELGELLDHWPVALLVRCPPEDTDHAGPSAAAAADEEPHERVAPVPRARGPAALRPLPAVGTEGRCRQDPHRWRRTCDAARCGRLVRAAGRPGPARRALRLPARRHTAVDPRSALPLAAGRRPRRQ